MNILLLFATNSGGTQMAAQMVADELSAKNHVVSLKNPTEVTVDELQATDAIVLASPSWDYESKEGQPHENFFPLMKALEGKTLENKPFSILGLGDSSYAHFCGAVDVFEELVKNLKGRLIVPSLRIGQFYTKGGNMEAVKQWGQQLTNALSAT